MYTVTVTEHFSAAHALYWTGGKREKPHRHRWKVAAIVGASKLNANGVVVDFVWLKKCLRRLLAGFKNKPLEAHAYFQSGRINATAENLARYIFDGLKKETGLKRTTLLRITVWETPEAWADYDGR